MAEMGQRPTEEELDSFIALFDHNGDQLINRKEFSRMVRVKLGLLDFPDDPTVNQEGQAPTAEEKGNTAEASSSG